MSFGQGIADELARRTFRILATLVLSALAVGVVLGAGLVWLWPHLPSIRLVW